MSDLQSELQYLHDELSKSEFAAWKSVDGNDRPVSEKHILLIQSLRALIKNTHRHAFFDDVSTWLGHCLDCARVNKENRPLKEVCDAIDFYTAASNFYHGATVKNNAIGTRESKRVSEFQEKRMNGAREYFSKKIFSSDIYRGE
jgi:hypothetical protein